MEKLEQKLGIKTSDHRYGNVSAEDLKMAADMFMYLNMCPGDWTSSELVEPYQLWFKAWFIFYNDLFKTNSVNKIILTLNRLINNSKDKNDKQRNQKIFERAADVFSLQYKEAQKMLSKKVTNENLEKNEGKSDIKGKLNMLLQTCHDFNSKIV